MRFTEEEKPGCDVAQAREALRRRLLQARIAMAPALRRQRTERIVQQLRERFRERLRADLLPVRGKTVGLYWPVRGECDIRSLAEEVVALGGVPALPAVVAPAAPITYLRWRPGEAMDRDEEGVACPAGWDAVRPQILLVPCLGFDTAGFRLGYGGGYYDRTLAGWARPPLVVGVAFGEARIEAFSPQPHDIPMDAIVTEEGWQGACLRASTL